MKIEELLPLGSVVGLKDNEKRVLIYGRFQLKADTQDYYDYVGCMYPEGNIGPENSYLFQQEQIETVYHIGFQDAEEFAYKAQAAAYFERSTPEI